MQIFQTVTVTMSQEIPRVLPVVLAPTPCPTLSRMKGCSESVGKKFTWRKNKHRVECGGEGRALHGPMQIDRDGSGHILRRWEGEGTRTENVVTSQISDDTEHKAGDNFTRSSSFLSGQGKLGRAARLV